MDTGTPPLAPVTRQPRAWRRGCLWSALVASGVIPILGLLTGPNTSLLIYTIFVAALLARRPLERLASALMRRLRLAPEALLAGAIVLSGWLTECLVWLGSYIGHDAHPALLHPQLIPDLILAIGFYGGWALAWLLTLWRWRFTLPAVFVVTGLMGIFVEQDGAVVRDIIAVALANPLLAILIALDIFAVYGSIMGLAYLPLAMALRERKRRGGWLRFPAVIALMFVGAVIGVTVVGLLASHTGLIPPRRPIWEHPLF
ncbi:MAG TPA: hypothetical protein VMV29_14435 [Ktedonobacterales bacterium]|nr:hypothetical protein [Ktedonobacterales bacterium]